MQPVSEAQASEQGEKAQLLDGECRALWRWIMAHLVRQRP